MSLRGRSWWLALALLCWSGARAEVRLARQFGDHAVLQRGRPVPVWGEAEPGEAVTVEFAGARAATSADSLGRWEVRLPAQPASAAGRDLTVTGRNTLTVHDVVVGDVWLCSGQSNMDMRLAGCNRPDDVAGADLPGVRQFALPIVSSDTPRTAIPAVDWRVCTPQSAAGFSATGFYFARKVWRDNEGHVPIGLLLAAVGGTRIDLWLAPEGLYDQPVLQPLLSQRPATTGVFTLFNGMVHPLAPYGLKGLLWYQGENSESTVQSPDSYYLKMKALAAGWQRVFGLDDLAFYFVMLANYGEPLQQPTPVLHSGGWDADTRLQQANAAALPHAGWASALDIGVSKVSWAGYHPQNKLEVGERLALWALKNDYGRPATVACGPVLRDVRVDGQSLVCAFDEVGGGLLAGAKQWYQPVAPRPDGRLQRFVLAGADGVWQPAEAVIDGATVRVSSPRVPAPRKVSYACWQNPEGCNLYNREGLPAAPFHVDDVTVRHTVTATAGEGGAVEPAGARRYLPRTTARYRVVPAPGWYVADVKVDGVAVGAVGGYTFDPLTSDHTLVASFTRTAPTYTLTVTAGGGGRVTPVGATPVPQGGSATARVLPDPGNRALVTVDGVPLGARERFSFVDVRANHTLAVAFTCSLAATAGYGGTIAPSGAVAVNYGDSQTFRLSALPGYTLAGLTVDGTAVAPTASYEFARVTASHTIAARFRPGASVAGALPRPDDLLVACRAAELPAAGVCAAWPAQVPRDRRLTAIGAPEVAVVDGRRYARLNGGLGQGFSVSTHAEPLPCRGATLVTVVRPVRTGTHAAWTSVVDVFYDRLVLGVRNDTGQVCVRRNGSVDDSATAIPDGQLTLLSLVAQPDGAYRVWANGQEVLARGGGQPLTALVPGVAGPFARQITLGRNAPDGWTAFYGDLGDVWLYQVALTDAERQSLEARLARELTE